jgi:hypothetical protein
MSVSRLRSWSILVAAVFGLLAGGADAAAQGREDGGVEFGGGALVGGSVSFGQTAATLDRPGGEPLVLFRTRNGQTAEFGLIAHVSVPVGGAVAAEVAGAWTRARLRSRVTGDLEGAADAVLEEQLSRFSVEAAGGWVRDVPGSDVAIGSGAVAHVGAGVKYWWALRGRRLRYGVRVDGRLAARWRGLVLDKQRVHMVPVLAVGLIIGS